MTNLTRRSIHADDRGGLKNFDNGIARVTTDVLRRFSGPQPFKAPIW